MKNILVLLLTFLFSSAFCSENKEFKATANVTEVTVFISGAQVMHEKSLQLPAGMSTIVFTNLSPYFDFKSVELKADRGLTILSVNPQYNYLDTARHSLKKEELERKLNVLNDKLDVANANRETVNDELQFLNDNRKISGKDQAVSLAGLKETADYYGKRVLDLRMQLIDIRKQIDNLTVQKTAIGNEINQIGSVKKKPVGEVRIRVDAPSAASYTFGLSYYVSNAGWFPSYDIRVRSIEEPVELVYKANIHQNTLEDWKDVRLKLSSSNPKLGGVAPQLQTYFLNYNTVPPRYSERFSSVSGRVYDRKTNEPLPGVAVKVKGTTIGVVSDENGNYALTLPDASGALEASMVGYEDVILPVSSPEINIAMTPQKVDLDEVVVIGYGSKKHNLKSLFGSRSASPAFKTEQSNIVPSEQVENQTSFEFDIKTPYTVRSNNKNMTVNIDDYSLAADYEYYTVPKVDPDAFLTAHVAGWEKYNLLEGEASIYFENTFVGKSVLNTRNTSDTLSISLGRDKNVLVKREAVKNMTTKQFIGNKQAVTRDWRITVKNNKKQPVHIILLDQVPVSTLGEITVEVDNDSNASWDKDNGTMQWKFSLDPAKRKVFELNYTVKFPKDRHLIVE